MSNRVAQRRRELELTQAQLATLVGLSRQSISAIESDGESPRLQVAKRLAAALETSLDYLFGSEEEAQVATGIYLGYLNGSAIFRETTSAVVTSHFPNALRTGGSSTLLDRPFVFVDGCDPLLAFLTRMVSEESHFRYLWTSTTNKEAVESVISERCHIGLVHFGEENWINNLPDGLTSFALADWNLVLATKRNSIYCNIDLSSLGDEAIRFALRKRGSGVRGFYDSIVGGSSEAAETFDSHQDVANAVRFGTYDATLTMESIAVNADLGFKVVQAQRSYLVVRNCNFELPEVRLFVEMVTNRRLKRKIDLLGGYSSI